MIILSCSNISLSFEERLKNIESEMIKEELVSDHHKLTELFQEQSNNKA